MRISDWSSDVCSSDLFGMFDYTPVGLCLLLMGLVFLRFGYHLLPKDRRATPTMGEALDVHAYVTEATLAEGSPAIDETIAAFVERHDHEIKVTSILRPGMRSIPLHDTVLHARDTPILGGQPEAIGRATGREKVCKDG